MNDIEDRGGHTIVEASQQITTRDYRCGEVFYIYASTRRPISAAWARIPNAVYMTANRRKEGIGLVHTYVIVSGSLPPDTVKHYELTLAYGPIVY